VSIGIKTGDVLCWLELEEGEREKGNIKAVVDREGRGKAN